MDLTPDELSSAKQLLNAEGFEVISIASPLLKCVLPGAPAIDTRFQHDVFASKHTFEDQPRLTKHAFSIAKTLGAPIVRVFSYWRTVKPEECFEAIVKALRNLAEQAAAENLIIGLENEHACNIGTGRETARVLAAVDHPNLKVVWDPANALVAGETPIPDGYRVLDPKRVAHVHAKDCHMEDHKPIWGPLGTRSVDWKGQIDALTEDGYKGWLSWRRIGRVQAAISLKRARFADGTYADWRPNAKTSRNPSVAAGTLGYSAESAAPSRASLFTRSTSEWDSRHRPDRSGRR